MWVSSSHDTWFAWGADAFVTGNTATRYRAALQVSDVGRYRYYGIGPEASVPLTKAVSMRIRAQWEFGSRNVVQGNNLWIIFAWRK